MSKIRFAINGFAWGREDLEKFLDTVATLGYCGVEVDGEIAAYHYDKAFQFNLLLSEREIALSSLVGRFELSDPLKQDDEVSYNKMIAEFARSCGTRLLILTVGAGKQGDDYEAGINRVAEVCGTLGEYCAMLGVKPCIRPQAGGLIAQPQDVERLFEKEQLAHLRLCLDAGWALAAGGNPAEFVRRWRERLAHVIFSDCECDGEMKSVAPGAGAVDFAALVEALGEINYEGWVVVDPGADCVEPAEFAEAGKEFIAGQLGLSVTFENTWTEGQAEPPPAEESSEAPEAASPAPAEESEPEQPCDEGEPADAEPDDEAAVVPEVPEVPEPEPQTESEQEKRPEEQAAALEAAPEQESLPPGESEARSKPALAPPETENTVFGAGIFQDEEDE